MDSLDTSLLHVFSVLVLCVVSYSLNMFFVFLV